MVEGWDDTPLRKIFANAYGLPTFVGNCVHAMAITEERFGHAKGLRNFLLVNVGWGIGSAIFIDGRLYNGRDGLAGELGHITVEENGGLQLWQPRLLGTSCLGLGVARRVRFGLEQRIDSSLKRKIGEKLEKPSVDAIVAAAKSGDGVSERVIGGWHALGGRRGQHR